ncbi:hypothetical protein [uncultured Parabacteroides sp.]|jgi:hypothetical protein|uniref:hypothetical protein n=1 Tax=uncultured Parabacteroides sp. TaxID=512312 RepID=UPI002587BABD|nr:hypothetical protein [uncultured Parabacteroides sp.]
MKKKSILSLILLLTVLCGFNSCQDKPFDPIDDDPEYLLCNATGWYDEYIDSNGYPCTQHNTLHSIPTVTAKKPSYAISVIFRETLKNFITLSTGNGMTITTDPFTWNTRMVIIFFSTS